MTMNKPQKRFCKSVGGLKIDMLFLCVIVSEGWMYFWVEHELINIMKEYALGEPGGDGTCSFTAERRKIHKQR